MQAKLLFIHALSPLHAGIGQGVGVIDQPIAREKATNIPYLPGSSVKGVFRDACTGTNCENIFGPATDNADAFAGSVSFSDARLLLLPVRSIAGVFAWVTSPYILQRLNRDLKEVDQNGPDSSVPIIENNNTCLISQQGSSLIVSDENGVILEDLMLTPESSADIDAWEKWLSPLLFSDSEAEQEALKNRICLVSDDVFSFLLEIGTQITARIRIEDETKTVAQGALWYEEALPAESILSSLVVASNVKAPPDEFFETIDMLTQKSIQYGGSATVGQGLCRSYLVPKQEEA
jgi:CRISPR-associated protein Cmr4